MTLKVTPARRLIRRQGRSMLLAVMLAAGSAQAQPAPPAQTSQPRPWRAPPTAAQQRRAAKAVELFDEARALYERGEYRKAIVKLKEALELDPEAKLLVYNLAVTHEKLAEVDAAERYYRQYLEMETDPKVVERVQGILKRIEGAKKELASAKAAAEDAKTKPPPPVAPEEPPISPWVIATGGVAAGALIFGTAFGISAVAHDPGTDVQTSDGVPLDELESDAETSHDHAVVADVSLILAALAAGTTVFLYFTTSSGGASTTKTPLRGGSARQGSLPTPPAPAADMALGLAPGRGVLRVRF
jgi:tetratricopeptide (TPR) repeat protein